MTGVLTSPEHMRHILASGPLHLLSDSRGNILPSDKCLAHPLTSFGSLLRCYLSVRPSLTTLIKFNTLTSGTLYLPSLLNFLHIYFTCLSCASASSQQVSYLNPGVLFYSLLLSLVLEKYLASSRYSANISGMNERVNE